MAPPGPPSLRHCLGVHFFKCEDIALYFPKWGLNL